MQPLSGAHQKSSGSTRVLPSTMKATTSPMLDGLKTCEPRYRMTYFDRSDRPADDREDLPGIGVPRVVGRRADDAEDEGDAAPGQHRAGGPHERPALAEGQDDLDDRAGQDRREDLRHAHLEVQPDLARGRGS